MKHKWKARKGI